MRNVSSVDSSTVGEVDRVTFRECTSKDIGLSFFFVPVALDFTDDAGLSGWKSAQAAPFSIVGSGCGGVALSSTVGTISVSTLLLS